ncbi:Lsr2 family protein [Nocardia sp. NPDC101769]|uniref:histone-like nucleoid-structuring protein Lsr2 n=1 Tax=Nocardia sp. NPDC101769 TaxID=3364333 RepID=UPI003807BF8D
MVRKLVVNFIDDLDGESEAAETISFGLDGVSYELDLSAPNANDLRVALSRWTTHARRVGHSPRSRSTRSKPADTRQNSVIRQWARDNGYDVQNRGRILSEIVTAYHTHHEQF